MTVVFWDDKGVLLVEFIERGTAIQLRNAHQSETSGKNFDYPPYSPDLPSSDCFLFLYLKRTILREGKGIQDRVMNWFDAQAENFYVEGLKELVLRYKKCLEANGNYVQIKILFFNGKTALSLRTRPYISFNSIQNMSHFLKREY